MNIVFNQGDVGSWWYVIFRGSVTVDIAGKGTVCTLKEGEEFGKLALVNNAPRAATIITAEDNTQFFKVPKQDFNRILVDVEANTIRLKEHGLDVLILLRLALKGGSSSPGDSSSTSGYTSSSSFGSNKEATGTPSSSSKLVVIAGTPDKMVEYCLESRFDSSWSPAEFQYNNYFYSHNFNNNSQHESQGTSGPTSLYSAHLDLLSKDTFFEDFILTFMIFIPSSNLCHFLFRHYKVEELQDVLPAANTNDKTIIDFFIRSKRRVVRFVYSWRSIAGDHFLSDASAVSFVNTLESCVKEDNCQPQSRFFNRLNPDLEMIQMLSREVDNFEQDYAAKGTKRWKSDLPGVLQIMTINSSGAPTTGHSPSHSPSRQLPSLHMHQSQRTLPSITSSAMFQAAAAVPGLATSQTGMSPTTNFYVQPQQQGLQTPPALLSSAYTSTNLSSAFVSGSRSGATSPSGGSPSGIIPFSVPIPASAAVAEYTSDPYFQEPIRPKDESEFPFSFCLY